MSDSKLAAVFFIDHGELTLEKYLEKSGAVDILPIAGETNTMSFLWAGWHCTGTLESAFSYRILIIYFWQLDFLKHFHTDGKVLRDDGLNDLLKSFTNACIQLKPLVAFIGSQVWEAEFGFIAKRASTVMKDNFESLLEDFFGVLFLQEKIYNSIDPFYYQDRDVIHIGLGYIVFAGQSNTRWL